MQPRLTYPTTRFAAASFAAVLLCVASCGGGQAQTAAPHVETQQPRDLQPKQRSYQIRLHRGYAVGAKYRVHSHGRVELAVRVNGKLAPGSHKIQCVYEAEVTVLQVEADGGRSRTRHKVAKLDIVADDATQSVLVAGTVVLADSDSNGRSFTVRGVKAAGTVHQCLEMTTSLGKGALYTDAMVGTTKRKKLGDSWAVDGGLVASEFAKRLKAWLPPKPQNVTGVASLVGTKIVDGIPSMGLTVRLDLGGITPVLPSVTFSDGGAKASTDVWLPIDPFSAATVGATNRMSIHATGTRGSIAVSLKLFSETTFRRTLLP